MLDKWGNSSKQCIMPNRKFVLVVEDDELIREAFCRFAKDAGGYEAIGVGNTQEAVTQMEKKRADVVLLDVFLKEENGLVFLEKFKKTYPDVPVVIITGAGYDQSLMDTALKNGAVGYVSKDAGLDNMVVTLKNALKARPS